jgi:hypothetical protein
LAGFGVIGFLSDLPVLFPLFAAGLFCAVLIISLRYSPASFPNRLLRGRNQKHRLFVPVQILRPKPDTLSFVFAMLPFTAIALALAISVSAETIAMSRLPSVPLAAPLAADLSSLFPEEIVTEADFYHHYNFQAAFSYRSLYNHDAQISATMPGYAFGTDGLPSEISGEGGDGLIDAEIMKTGFSLSLPGKLAWEPATFSRRNIIFPALLSFALPLFFIIPALVRRKQTYR